MKSTKDLLKIALGKGMKPPENMTVSQWSDSFRQLPSDSAEPGKWRTSRVPYMREVMDAFTQDNINRVVVKSAAQVGKALSINEPIPTPDGFKRMGDLTAGDKVFDERGAVCNVIATSPIMYDRPCYEITFSDGAKIIADAGHQWIADDKLMTTAELRVGMTLPDVILTAELQRVIDSNVKGGVRK